jgi:hypothetical protein
MELGYLGVNNEFGIVNNYRKGSISPTASNRDLMKNVYNKKCTKYSRIEKFVSKLHKEILDLHGWYVPSDVKTQKSDAIVY